MDNRPSAHNQVKTHQRAGDGGGVRATPSAITGSGLLLEGNYAMMIPLP